VGSESTRSDFTVGVGGGLEHVAEYLGAVGAFLKNVDGSFAVRTGAGKITETVELMGLCRFAGG